MTQDNHQKENTPNSSNQQRIKELIDIITLKKLGDDIYQGISMDFVGKRIFGGQVLAQSLMAAAHTTDRPCHSLHAYFLRGGDISAPVDYHVTRLRDGRTIQSRQVTAMQFDKVIFTATMSFAQPEDGLDYQIDIPDSKPADELMSEQQIKEKFEQFIPTKHRDRMMRERHIEIRPVKFRNVFAPQKEAPKQAAWLRVTDEHNQLPDVSDYKTHQALFAFLSDYYLLGTSLQPHGISFLSEPKLQAATIDHSIHFHKTVDATDWLLHDMRCDVTCSARGLNQGQVWQRGELIISTQQEGLIRVREITKV